MADCYEKRLYSAEATDIFRLVLKSPDQILDDRFKFAYNATMSHKYREEGLAMYKALLADPEGSAFTQRVLDNAHEYLMKGKIAAAKGVYGLLAEHDKRFYKIYADDFYDAGFNLHALHEYKIMAGDQDLAKAGKEGMVKAYVAENDYNLSVSTYVEAEDTREVIDIVKLNAELDEIRDGIPDHVGIVKDVKDGYVYCIEGNYRNTCKETKYAIGHKNILGYGTPKY